MKLDHILANTFIIFIIAGLFGIAVVILIDTGFGRKSKREKKIQQLRASLYALLGVAVIVWRFIW